MCLTLVSGSSEGAAYLKDLEAIVDLLIHSGYIKNSNFWVFLKNLFLGGGKLLYNAVLVSALQQCESAIDILCPSLLNLAATLHPSRVSQSPSLSSLSHIANFYWLPVLCMVMYMFQCYSQFIPPSPSLSVSMSSICLCRYSCPTNRLISTIFLDSIYMH